LEEVDTHTQKRKKEVKLAWCVGPARRKKGIEGAGMKVTEDQNATEVLKKTEGGKKNSGPSPYGHDCAFHQVGGEGRRGRVSGACNK